MYILPRAALPFSSGSFFFFFWLSVNSVCSDQSSLLLLDPVSGLFGAQIRLLEHPECRCLSGDRSRAARSSWPQVEKLTTSSSWHALPMSSPPASDRGHSVHPFTPSWPPSAGSSVQLLYTLMSLRLPSTPGAHCLCRPHASADLPPSCLAPGLCPQVAWR